MTRIWSTLVSLRTTAVLLVVLCALLLVNVALPQAAVDPDAYGRAVRSGWIARLALEDLGLGHVATSPAFLAALVAFFANLAAVLVDRVGTTVRRMRFTPPTPAQVGALLAGPGTLEVSGAGAADGRAAEVLGRMGYRTAPAGPGAVWGVKHRLALAGFPLFHASFFLICAGGLWLYLTRNVVTLLVTEGREEDSARGGVVRRAPLGPPPPVRVALERVDIRLESGKPVDLAAVVALDGAPAGTARVNHPVERGEVSVLVERAGIAPVLRLEDARGFTIDRVLVPAANPAGLATRVELGGGEVEVAIEPIPLGPRFPERDRLAVAPVALRIRARGATVFGGELRPGTAVAFGDRSLALQEVRYWGAFRIVSERGGGLLVAGFALSIVGIVWRMLLFRREIVVARDGDRIRIAGRAEFFPTRLGEELELVRELLGVAEPGTVHAARAGGR